jgi:hypothetical protein
LYNPAWNERATASHDACKVAAKAMLGTNLIYLYGTAWLAQESEGENKQCSYLEPLSWAVASVFSVITVLLL